MKSATTLQSSCNVFQHSLFHPLNVYLNSAVADAGVAVTVVHQIVIWFQLSTIDEL